MALLDEGFHRKAALTSSKAFFFILVLNRGRGQFRKKKPVLFQQHISSRRCIFFQCLMDFGLKNPNIVFEVLLLVLFAQLAVTVKPGGPPYLSRCGGGVNTRIPVAISQYIDI